MKDTLSKVLIFAVGAAIGSVVTWKLIETKYKRIADEEIESVKRTFAERYAKVDEEPEETTMESSEETYEHVRTNYADIVRNNYSEETMTVGTKPYVIPPEEFGEMDEYDQVSLTYYADGTLTDDRDYPVEDVDSVVGKDSLTHFGEYEDDSVFVRNDMTKTDYEILLDPRRYSDVVNYNSHPRED